MPESVQPLAPPVLSVVVPIHRVEPYLAECLESILREAGAELEVVAVDDASPDRSGEIAAGYARRDPRVRVVRLARNVGLGPARNAGLERATGEYVWFVDSDDRLPPGAVPAVLERLATTRPEVLIVDHADVFEGDHRAVPGNPAGLLAGLAGRRRLADHPQLLRLAQSACTKIVRRGLLVETGLRFFPGWYEDSSFSNPLLLAAVEVEVLDRVCYHYLQRAAGGITRTVSPRHFEVFEQYRRLFDVMAANPRYEPFRPELFRLMIDHYLVIIGNRRRVPTRMRRAFFRRMTEDYRVYHPGNGYQLPPGLAGLRHRLVRRNAYLPYWLLRLAHRAVIGLLRLGGAPARRRPAGPPAAPAPAPASPRSDRAAGRTPGR